MLVYQRVSDIFKIRVEKPSTSQPSSWEHQIATMDYAFEKKFPINFLKNHFFKKWCLPKIHLSQKTIKKLRCVCRKKKTGNSRFVITRVALLNPPGATQFSPFRKAAALCTSGDVSNFANFPHHKSIADCSQWSLWSILPIKPGSLRGVQ